MSPRIERLTRALAAVLVLGFMLVPAQALEAGPVVCLVRRLWGVSCPGCGLTRALVWFFHLDFQRAAGCNGFVFMWGPALLMIASGLGFRLLRVARGGGTR